MPLTTEFLLGLKKNAPKSLASSVWQQIVKLKINKKRKTRRGTRAGTDTRQKTSYKIPSITSDPLLAQTNKLHLAQNRSTTFKRSNFSNLKTDLVKERNVSKDRPSEKNQNYYLTNWLSKNNVLNSINCCTILKKSFIFSSIKTCKKDTKKLYQIVGKFLKSYSSNKLPQICPAHELPNAFATFFQNKIVMLHQDLSTNQSAVCAPEENDVVFDGTTFDQFNPVTTVDVNNILHSSNSTNCKLDPLPAVLLKKCSSVVVNAITVIINNSLKSSQVPLEFKKAIISPLLKSHNLDPDTLANYRPISHLSFLSKV